MDKLYLSVFTQSSEVGCLEIPYATFSNTALDSKFRLFESSISPEKERGHLKVTGEIRLKIVKLDDVCLRCEGLEKLVRDIKVNMYDIEDTVHSHPAKVHSLSVSLPVKDSVSLMIPGKELFSVLMPNKDSFYESQSAREPFAGQSLGKEEKKLGGVKKNPKSKALRSGKSNEGTGKLGNTNSATAASDQDLKKMLEESYKSRQDLLSSVNETTEQLSNQLKEQGDSLDKALADRSAAMSQLLKLSEDLKKIQQENQQLLQLLEEKDIVLNNLKPKAVCSESYESELNHLTDELEKCISENNALEKKLQESLEAFSKSNNNQNKRVQDLTAEKAELLSKLEELIKQNHSLRNENDKLNNLVNELCAKIATMQAELDAAQARESREKHLHQLLIGAEEAKNLMKKELDTLGNKYADQAGKLAKDNSRLLQEKGALDNHVLDMQKKLEDKDKEIGRLMRELDKAVGKIGALEQGLRASQGLSIIVESLTQQNSDLEGQMRKLSDQIDDYKETIENQDDQIREQTDKISELESNRLESEERLASLENVIDELRKERGNAMVLDEKGNVYKPNKDDPIDIALSDYVNTRPGGVKVQFDREDHGIYNFGTKKIFVKLEQGKLLIRVGGGFMQVEDFVKLYSPVELERFSNIKKEQAQKIRQSYLGKYADSLAVNKNKKEISPERAIKLLKDQMASGSYTPYYAVQLKSPDRSSNRSPVASERISRISN